MTLGGGWFCGGAEAVKKDSGGVEVQPPEEHACRQGENYVIFILAIVQATNVNTWKNSEAYFPFSCKTQVLHIS